MLLGKWISITLEKFKFENTSKGTKILGNLGNSSLNDKDLHHSRQIRCKNNKFLPKFICD